MKHFLLLVIGITCLLTAHAKPRNLYEQLCEVNQEWKKNRAIAEELNFPNMPVMAGEQNILSFHIQTLEQIFRKRDASRLSPALQQARAQHLQNLNEYWKRRDCPRNYYLPYRNPVFIDHEGRYCAVAYLMRKSGMQAFCEAVQKLDNFIFVRQINLPEFHAWQQESGLSLDELAWIQPGYDPQIFFYEWDRRDAQGRRVALDSAASVKIYNVHYDYKDMFRMSAILFEGASEPEALFKKLKPAYAGKPDWSQLNDRVLCMAVYKNELYISTDSMKMLYVDSNFVYQTRSSIMKWNNTDKKWTTVLDLKGENKVYCFFDSRGRLYAGGGRETSSTYDEKTEIYTQGLTHSFLASTNGRDWKISPEEFGGYIFSLVYKDKKRYLGTVYNWIGSRRAPVK